MPFVVLSLMIQVAFIVHIVKTGRSTIWIWIVVLLPGAGSIAYVILEILPELMESRAVRRASRSMEQIINPNKGINAAAQDYSVSNTIYNSLKLADECMSKEMYEEAKQLYEKSLAGIHENDPEIMFGLEQAKFCLDNFVVSKHFLDQLIQKTLTIRTRKLIYCSLNQLRRLARHLKLQRNMRSWLAITLARRQSTDMPCYYSNKVKLTKLMLYWLKSSTCPS
jgi:hypothetical protein